MVKAACGVLSDGEFCEVHFQIGCLKMSLTPMESGVRDCFLEIADFRSAHSDSMKVLDAECRGQGEAPEWAWSSGEFSG